MVDTAPDYTKGIGIREQEISSLAIDIISQSINQLAVDIAAQSVGDITTDISAQSVGNLTTDINAQSIGDLDILINDQNIGVETGTEFAASQNNIVTGVETQSLNSGDAANGNIFSNNTGGRVVAEQLTLQIRSNFSNDIEIEFTVEDSNNNRIAAIRGNPQNFPVSLNPGVPMPDGGRVFMETENNSANFVSVEASFIGRMV